MSSSRKQLPLGDDRALFTLSRGRCYAPGCAVPTFQKVDGHYKGQLIQAHIYAHSPGGPRYDPNMTQAQRDSWTNIILLCASHHGLVDTSVDKYPAELLLRWKSDREEGLVGDLPELQGISDLDLQQMLLAQINKVMNGMDQIKGVDQDVIDELKRIVEQEFIDPNLDTDAMRKLFLGASRLEDMAGEINLLHRAAVLLEENAPILMRASRDLQHLAELDVSELQQVGTSLNSSSHRLSSEIRKLEKGTNSLRKENGKATSNMVSTDHSQTEDDEHIVTGIAFLFGLIIGAGAVIGIWYLISNGGLSVLET